jgi:glycylpeptide N-tetradecanoyltransferase
VTSDDTLDQIHDLLSNHYVEDDDNMFRFAYSREFLRWALLAPGYRLSWMCGVRVSAKEDGKKGKLVAFISAIPVTMSVHSTAVEMVEINFLCVHKKLRQKRLAPVMIKEITRRVNLCGIWQAVYTAGVLLPKPVAQCQYWHRPLNPKKLIAVGFSRQGPRMTMARTIKLYKVPEAPTIPGVRKMEARDVASVTSLLEEYMIKFELAPKFTEEDVRHWLVFQNDVISSYVVESNEGCITDFFSFYTLPSTIIGNAEYSELKAAYMFYTAPGAYSVEDLLKQSLILAAATGHDVFNALDILDNSGPKGTLLKDLKFGEGDGRLRYYLYNWRCAEELNPSQVGLVML